MNVLLVDNYDSFTFNLYQLASQVFGLCVHVVRNDDDWETILNARFDAAIISPGPGRPDRVSDFGISSAVISEMEVPVLGVCLGHQGICHLFGGEIVHAPQPMHGRRSEVFHHGSGLFQDVPSPFKVVRYHSLICPSPLPACLKRTAWTSDDILMGVAHRSRPIWGVQFHPESICTEFGCKLMENFRAMVEKRNVRTSVSAKSVHLPPTSSENTQAPEAQTPNRYQIFMRRFDLDHDPAYLFERLFEEAPYAFWLDSSLNDGASARFSYMGSYGDHEIEGIRYYANQRRLELQRGSRVTRDIGDLFSYLKTRLIGVEVDGQALPFEFAGGFVGYFGYELKVLCGARSAYASVHPDAYLLRVERFLAIDHATQQVYLVFLGDADKPGQADQWFDGIESALKMRKEASDAKRCRRDLTEFKASQSHPQYLESIRECLEAIKDGESYEICLTNQLKAETAIHPFQFYKLLRQRNPAPYSAFLQFPELSVACSSPERFLKVETTGIVESKPIKGTLPRGVTDLEDEALRRSLANDEKSRAENLMIVDLLRNDLGKVCEVGSVSVPKLMHVESYATVHQLVSTVAGRLRADQTAVDCLRAAFPGGSMTGAPKIRTMEIIESLEREARGIYSGTIGFLSFNGSADLNIVIRTAVFGGRQVTVGVGGAIVALSDPEEEWDEILLKARALLLTFGAIAGTTAKLIQPENNTDSVFLTSDTKGVAAANQRAASAV